MQFVITRAVSEPTSSPVTPLRPCEAMTMRSQPVLVAIVTCIVMGGWDRALMLALPGLAVLAAFALPTMKRSVTAGIDFAGGAYMMSGTATKKAN